MLPTAADGTVGAATDQTSTHGSNACSTPGFHHLQLFRAKAQGSLDTRNQVQPHGAYNLESSPGGVVEKEMMPSTASVDRPALTPPPFSNISSPRGTNIECREVKTSLYY